ncbi:MAG: twin-arginine translocation signal domain-containing protein, partial [Omnitrophica WOR_2 bacterium]
MRATFSRRDFLKLAGLSAGTIPAGVFNADHWLRFYPIGLGRVTFTAINIYEQPSFDSQRAGKHYRDELLAIFEEVRSTKGPAHNPLWYRVDRGY